MYYSYLLNFYVHLSFKYMNQPSSLSSTDSAQDWNYQDLRDRRKVLTDVETLEMLLSKTKRDLEGIERSETGLKSVVQRIGSFFRRDAFLDADDAAQKKDDLRRELEEREAAYEEAKQRLAELDQRLYGPFPVVNPRTPSSSSTDSMACRPLARPLPPQPASNVIHPNVAAWQRNLARLSEDNLASTPPHLKEVFEVARERARRAVEDQRAKVGANRPHLKVVSNPAAPSPVPPEFLARNQLASVPPEKLYHFRQQAPMAADHVLTGIKRARSVLGFNPSLHSEFLELQEAYQNLKLEADLLNERKTALEKQIASRGGLSKLWIRFTKDRTQEELAETTSRLAHNEASQQSNFDRRMEIKSHFDTIAA